ncbi:MAG: DUF4062 domain-containing protein [Candidatus Margulisbacteria bacterium]|nr:DUF4062 domain-containing protein [Candidatus Margulisiibacteriota bacterium]
MVKPRVFVSSVMEEFEEYRNAAREVITESGGYPILIEDFPSSPISSRNACLDLVDTCEIFTIIISDRGGWTCPSGLLVIQEEYNKAKVKGIPIIVLIENIDRDNDAQGLVEIVSNYVSGHFRKMYNNISEYKTLLKSALDPVIDTFNNEEATMNIIEGLMDSSCDFNYNAGLRFVVMPDRDVEIFNQSILESKEFDNEIMAITHNTDINILSYKHSCCTNVELNKLIITQEGNDTSNRLIDFVRIEISNKGALSLDVNVTGLENRSNGGYHLGDTATIVKQDVEKRLSSIFLFLTAFYNKFDQYNKFNKFYYNISLKNVGHRIFVNEPITGSSVTMNMSGSNDFLVFDKEKMIARQALSEYQNHIDNAISIIRRKMD